MKSESGRSGKTAVGLIVVITLVVVLFAKGLDIAMQAIAGKSSFHVVNLPIIMPWMRSLWIAFLDRRKIAVKQLALLFSALVGGFAGVLIGFMGAILRDWMVSVLVIAIGMAITLMTYLNLEDAMKDARAESGF